MKKKLKLEDLRVKSFITEGSKRQMQTLKGGIEWSQEYTAELEKCNEDRSLGGNIYGCIAR